VSRCASYCDLPLGHPGEHHKQVEISPLGVLGISLWLEELERCPTCGSLDTQQDRAAPAFRECLACGGRFDPFDPKAVQARRQAIKDSFRGMEGL